MCIVWCNMELNDTLESGTNRKSTIKSLFPQIWASLVVALGVITSGNSVAYTAILLPQLEANNSTINLTKTQASWIASILGFMGPIGALSSNYLVNKVGKLNTLKVAAVLTMLAWATIALSVNFPMLITGRIIIGFAIGLFVSPSMVYIAEIAQKDIRGSLLTLTMVFAVTGVTITYLKGWLLNWRTVAWTSNIYVFIHFIGLFCIPESPLWLISKRRDSKARDAVLWLCRNQGVKFAESLYTELKIEAEKRNPANSKKKNKFKQLFKPTAYKPLLIMVCLYIMQQFSGIFIFLCYSVSFLKAAGTTVNPYLASVSIGIVRLIMTLLTAWLSKIFARRPLMITSTCLTSIFIFISGLYTHWIKSGSSDKTWVPAVFIILYTMSATVGPLTITFNLGAEIFPNEIRDLGSSLTNCIYNVTMFLAVYNYGNLLEILGGSAGLQFFFSAVAAAGLIFEVVFLPETHKKSLTEIEEYFRHNTFYLCQDKKDITETSISEPEQTSLVEGKPFEI